MKRILLALFILILPCTVYAQQLDRRICDASGDCLNVNSDGTIPISGIVSSSGDITDVYGCSSGDCNDIDLADGDILDMSAVNASSSTEGLILPQNTSCSSAIGEGQVCWDSDGNVLFVGTGTETTGLYSGGAGTGTGDITDVFGCSSGDCYDVSLNDGDRLNMSAVNASSTTEGLILPQTTDCSNATAEGQICWNTSEDVLYVGTSAIASGLYGYGDMRKVIYDIDGDSIVDQTERLAEAGDPCDSGYAPIGVDEYGNSLGCAPLAATSQWAYPWTSLTGYVYLETLTDDVVIGSQTPVQGGKLSIDGDTDQTQMVIMGHTTQTAPLQVWKQYDGTHVVEISNEGRVEIGTGVNGSIAIAERSAADTSVAGYVQIWGKDDSPNTLWFTDDTGVDYQLGVSTGNETITLSGDVDGTGTTAITTTVDDDSHNHTTTTISGLDISADTNLTAGDHITLTDDDLDIDDDFILNTGDSGTGDYDFSAANFELPNTTSCTSETCDAANEAGRICVDTDATSGQQVYVCEGLTGWIKQGDGGGASTPGGSSTQMQYNNAGAFGGMPGWVTNGMDVGVVGTLNISSGTNIVPNATSCSSHTKEGDLCWDSDNDVLYVGTAQVGTGLTAISNNYKMELRPHQAKLPSTGSAAINPAGNAIYTALFDADSAECLYWPSGFLHPAAGTLKAKLAYKMASASSGTVEFELSTGCVADGGADDDGIVFSTADNLSATVPGSAGTMDILSDASLVGDSCGIDNLIYFRVCRDADDGTNDTATGDAEYIGGVVYAE